MSEATYNAADNHQVTSRKRREDREKLRNEDAVKFVMGNALGRHFVWNLLSDAGLFRQPFTGNSTTDFQCGRMDVGLKLMRKLEEQAPDEFVSMWQEQMTAKQTARKEEAA